MKQLTILQLNCMNSIFASVLLVFQRKVDFRVLRGYGCQPVTWPFLLMGLDVEISMAPKHNGDSRALNSYA